MITSTEGNKALVRRAMAALDQGDDTVLNEVFAPDFVHRNPADPAMPHGPEGMRQMMARWRSAFPDAADAVEQQIAEGDWVATRWTFRGTHRGELFGVAPTSKAVTMGGIFIDRIREGKIVEHWDEADIAGLMEQLGAT